MKQHNLAGLTRIAAGPISLSSFVFNSRRN